MTSYGEPEGITMATRETGSEKTMTTIGSGSEKRIFNETTCSFYKWERVPGPEWSVASLNKSSKSNCVAYRKPKAEH